MSTHIALDARAYYYTNNTTPTIMVAQVSLCPSRESSKFANAGQLSNLRFVQCVQDSSRGVLTEKHLMHDGLYI